MLGQQEMMNLSGGEQVFKCRTNETCNLFIEAMGITVQGKCHYSSNGTTVSCYCKNGNYSTTSRSWFFVLAIMMPFHSTYV